MYIYVFYIAVFHWFDESTSSHIIQSSSFIHSTDLYEALIQDLNVYEDLCYEPGYKRKYSTLCPCVTPGQLRWTPYEQFPPCVVCACSYDRMQLCRLWGVLAPIRAEGQEGGGSLLRNSVDKAQGTQSMVHSVCHKQCLPHQWCCAVDQSARLRNKGANRRGPPRLGTVGCWGEWGSEHLAQRPKDSSVPPAPAPCDWRAWYWWTRSW